jgi:hypothetical protein
MVNGEVVLPLSPDMDMKMPSTHSSVTFGQMQLPQRRACARPRAHHASVPCLPWVSDDPTDGLLKQWPRPVGVTGHPMRIVIMEFAFADLGPCRRKAKLAPGYARERICRGLTVE